jgi:hypothetical protein
VAAAAAAAAGDESEGESRGRRREQLPLHVVFTLLELLEEEHLDLCSRCASSVAHMKIS